MEFISITCIILSVIKFTSAGEAEIVDYFNSETFKTIQNYWQKEMKGFENAISLILEQEFGSDAMNVYVRSVADPFIISEGFIFSDNIVNLVLLDTRLNLLPLMIAPAVNFELASNRLKIDSELSKMILTANYVLIRNQSDIVFTASEQDATKKSPFSFQQVQEIGELGIIAQECTLDGYTIASFVGNTVSLGLDTFRISNCKFSIEIYSPGVGSPPVFSAYFSKEQSLALEAMISNPIRSQLVPKLQAAAFSYVNTSRIFRNKLQQLRSDQNRIFKETSNYIRKVVGNFVQKTIKMTQGVLKLKPLDLLWIKNCVQGTCKNNVKVTNVTVYGLDTAYSAHNGGPFRASKSPYIAETIRFSPMQVRGMIYFENSTINGTHEFAVELTDVSFNIEMMAQGKSFILEKEKIFFTGWRSLEFSILQMYMFSVERRAAESFVTGYLLNEIPKSLIDHISKTFGNGNDGYSEHEATSVEKIADVKGKQNRPGLTEPEDEAAIVNDSTEDGNENTATDSDHEQEILTAKESSSNEDEKDNVASILSEFSDKQQESLTVKENSSVEDKKENAATDLSNPSGTEKDHESAAQSSQDRTENEI